MLEQSQQPLKTLLLSNQGKKVEKMTNVACAIMARDYKGFGNQAMNAVLVPPTYGIKIGDSAKFAKPPLKDCSRTIDCQGHNGVILINE